MTFVAWRGEIIRLFWVILQIAISSAQITTTIRNQPTDLDFGDILPCCNIDNSQELYTCVRRVIGDTAHSRASVKESVELVSFTTPNIVEYAAYAHAVNSAYSLQNGYMYSILSPETGHDFEQRDARWNKVRILHDRVEEMMGKGQLIAWLDSDLIVLDMGLSLEHVAAAAPQSDIILSRDPLPDEIMSVANTGMILVKPSKFSLAFLHEWWTRKDRSTVWDQHVFTDMWESDFMGCKTQGKVMLLAPDALNSHRPATVYQQPYNQVLHMIGSVTHHRRLVFDTAWSDICAAGRGSQIVLSPQLGLSRDALIAIEHRVLSQGPAKALAFAARIDSTLADVQNTIRAVSVDTLVSEWGEVRRLNEDDNAFIMGRSDVVLAMDRGLEGLVLLAVNDARSVDVSMSDPGSINVLQTALDLTCEFAVRLTESGRSLTDRMRAAAALDAAIALPSSLPDAFKAAATFYHFKLEHLWAQALMPEATDALPDDVADTARQHWRRAMKHLGALRALNHPVALRSEALGAMALAVAAECEAPGQTTGRLEEGLRIAREGRRLAAALHLQQMAPQSAEEEMRALQMRCEAKGGDRRATRRQEGSSGRTGVSSEAKGTQRAVYRRKKKNKSKNKAPKSMSEL